jgi:hypothetical protein
VGHHSVLLEKSTGRVLTFGAAALGHWSNALWQFHRLSQFARGFHTGARGTSTGCGGIDGGDVDWDRLLQYVRDVSQRTGVRQCGLGSTNIHAPMWRISELDGRRIVQAEGRYCHTLARTIEGHVHTRWVDPRMVSVASMQTMDDRFRWRRGWLCPMVTTVPSSRWPRG